MLGRVGEIDVVVVSQRLDMAAAAVVEGRLGAVDVVHTVVAVEVDVALADVVVAAAEKEALACVHYWEWGLTAYTLLPPVYCSLQVE